MAKKEKMGEWSNDFGLDPRQNAHIRPNGKAAPTGLDWDAMINAAQANKKTGSKTLLGLANEQQARAKKKS